MMKFRDLFTKKQQVLHESKPLPKWQEKLLAKQMKYAKWMQLKSEKLSTRYKWAVLCCFLLSSISLSAYLLIKPTPIKEAAVKIIRIKTPVSLEQFRQKDFLTEAEYTRLKQFRIYMDSLARSPGDGNRFHKFNAAHPGLLDSIRTLEQLYDLQFKNMKKWK